MTGRAIPGYRAKIVDDAMAELPRNTVGSLAVRGATGCRYLDDVEQQKAYVRDGWNLTGDAYAMDEAGYFKYQSRTDDMIISAGYNISGPEIEAVLLDHPQVQECVVIGVPDESRGMIVKAFIVPVDPASPPTRRARSCRTSSRARSRPTNIRAPSNSRRLPRTETGKVQRFLLREQERQKAGR